MGELISFERYKETPEYKSGLLEFITPELRGLMFSIATSDGAERVAFSKDFHLLNSIEGIRIFSAKHPLIKFDLDAYIRNFDSRYGQTLLKKYR
jgi:hypothetical protein